jgi:thioredoxin 1
MQVLPLTQDNFDAAVAQAPLLAIGFSADPEGFAARAAEVDVDTVQWGHVDTRIETGLAGTFGIQSGPALLIFRERVVLYLESGEHDSARMADLLHRVCALDMQAVRAEIEAQKQAELAVRMRRVCPTSRRGPMPE